MVAWLLLAANVLFWGHWLYTLGRRASGKRIKKGA